jgi:hypothetical protein
MTESGDARPKTGYRILDTGYWILDTGYWILKKYKIIIYCQLFWENVVFP